MHRLKILLLILPLALCLNGCGHSQSVPVNVTVESRAAGELDTGNSLRGTAASESRATGKHRRH